MRLKTVAGAVLGALIACSLCAAPLALAEEAVPGGSAPVLGEPEVEQPTPPAPETFKGQEFAKGSFTYKISKISSAAIEKGSCEVTLLKYTGSGANALERGALHGDLGELLAALEGGVADGAHVLADGDELELVALGVVEGTLGDGRHLELDQAVAARSVGDSGGNLEAAA